MKRYRCLGVAILEWNDACIHWRRTTLEQCQTIPQFSVGEVIYDREQKTYIVIHSTQRDGNEFDCIVVPAQWATKITPLVPKKGGKR